MISTIIIIIIFIIIIFGKTSMISNRTITTIDVVFTTILISYICFTWCLQSKTLGFQIGLFVYLLIYLKEGLPGTDADEQK